MSRGFWLMTLLVVLPACHHEDPAHKAMRGRLKLETRLSPEEIARLLDLIAPQIANKKVTVTQGALTRTLDEQARTSLLGMLSDPQSVYDGGLRLQGMTVLRGLQTGGTSILSELDATQTLWIDADTFVPRRYEFEYSSPGFGDYAYDLSFIP